MTTQNQVPTGTRAVIMAGGKGSRLAPYTTVLPKPLMPIGDMPILEIVIRQLRLAGIQHITLCVGSLASLVEAYFGTGSRWDVEVTYSFEAQPLGTAGPLGLLENLDAPFLVMNGDILTSLSVADMMRQHVSSSASATIAGCKREIRIDLGVLETYANRALRDYVEKPIHTYTASMGIYVFDPAVRRLIPRNARLDLPDLIRELLRLSYPVSIYHFDGYWLDIGRHDDFVRASDEFPRMRAELLPGYDSDGQ